MRTKTQKKVKLRKDVNIENGFTLVEKMAADLDCYSVAWMVDQMAASKAAHWAVMTVAHWVASKADKMVVSMVARRAVTLAVCSVELKAEYWAARMVVLRAESRAALTVEYSAASTAVQWAALKDCTTAESKAVH